MDGVTNNSFGEVIVTHRGTIFTEFQLERDLHVVSGSFSKTEIVDVMLYLRTEIR